MKNRIRTFAGIFSVIFFLAGCSVMTRDLGSLAKETAFTVEFYAYSSDGNSIDFSNPVSDSVYVEKGRPDRYQAPEISGFTYAGQKYFRTSDGAYVVQVFYTKNPVSDDDSQDGEDTPADDETPSADDTPSADEDLPEGGDTPSTDEEPSAGDEEPSTDDETPSADEEPSDDDTPFDDDTPADDDAPSGGDVPSTDDDTPSADDTPSGDSAPETGDNTPASDDNTPSDTEPDTTPDSSDTEPSPEPEPEPDADVSVSINTPAASDISLSASVSGTAVTAGCTVPSDSSSESWTFSWYFDGVLLSDTSSSILITDVSAGVHTILAAASNGNSTFTKTCAVTVLQNEGE